MATTKLGGHQLKFTTAQAFTGSGGVSSGMIYDDGVGLVLSGLRIYTAQLTPDHNNEVATKKYVDDQSGGSLPTRSIAFGQTDGSGTAGDASLTFLTGSGGFSGGLFFGSGKYTDGGDGTGVDGPENMIDGDIVAAGSGSFVVNQARVMVSGSNSVQLVSSRAAANAIIIDATNAAGGIDMDAGTGTVAIDAGGISLDSAGVAANFTVASDGAGEDLTIEVTGATDSSVLIKSSGTGADAISLASSAGGIDITATGAAGEDIDIDATTSSVNVTGSEAERDAVKILADTSGGGIQLQVADADGVLTMGNASADTYVQVAAHGTPATEIVKIVNSAGTLEGTDDAGAIEISAAAGGIALAWADTKDLWAEGGQFVVTANHDTAAAIKLHADTGTSQTIQIINDAGTVDGTYGAGAIDIEATAGGISMLWADGMDLWMEGGRAVVTANEDAADAIKLHADAGSSQTITLLNDAGTAVSDSAAAIQATSTLGAVTLNAGVANAAALRLYASNAAGGIDMDSGTGGYQNTSTGRLMLTSSLNSGDAAAIQMLASAGGIDIDAVGTASEDINITNSGGSVNLIATEANAYAITANATAGGILLNAAGAAGGTGDLILQSSAASVQIVAAEDEADAIAISAATGGIQAVAGGLMVLQATTAAQLTSTTSTLTLSASAGVTVGGSVTFTGGAGTDVNVAAAGLLQMPAYVDNGATVTAHASASAGYTNGTVFAGSGIAEIYMSGTLGSGQSIYLTGGFGTEPLYANSLSVHNNGILLLSGASNDYTTNLIMTGGAGTNGGLRIDFVDQPLVDGDVLQFRCRAKRRAVE